MPNEILYWTLSLEGHPSGGIYAHRAVYYEQAEHKDVEGAHGEHGAPWNNQWAIYEKQPSGWLLTTRVDGDIQEWFARCRNVFFNEREAKLAWKVHCQRNVERLVRELEPWRVALEKAEAALA